MEIEARKKEREKCEQQPVYAAVNDDERFTICDGRDDTLFFWQLARVSLTK